jgi:hypothetical protein
VTGLSDLFKNSLIRARYKNIVIRLALQCQKTKARTASERKVTLLAYPRTTYENENKNYGISGKAPRKV